MNKEIGIFANYGFSAFICKLVSIYTAPDFPLFNQIEKITCVNIHLLQ